MSHFLFSDRSKSSLTIAIAEQPLVKLLLLRALFDMGCINSLLREHCFYYDQVAHFFGLQGLLADYDRKKALACHAADTLLIWWE